MRLMKKLWYPTQNDVIDSVILKLKNLNFEIVSTCNKYININQIPYYVKYLSVHDMDVTTKHICGAGTVFLAKAGVLNNVGIYLYC